MDLKTYLDLKDEIIKRGFIDEINWSEDIKPCQDSTEFCIQFIWVVCNSGMKNQIAEKIYKKILQAICDKKDISDVFGHKGKVSAIKLMINQHELLFDKYTKAKDKIEFCKNLPFIGNITKYHLAKNLGADCAKPDRHLIRIAKKYDTDVLSLCKKLANQTGDKLRTVDIIIWRACNLKLI